VLLRLLASSLRAVLRRPWHSLLVLQGVIWGTALGVVPPAILHGSLERAERSASSLGTDRILVAQERVDVPRRFRWSDLPALRRELAGEADRVTGLAVLTGREDVRVPTIAGTSELARALRLELARGRGLTAEDVREARPVAVLEHDLAQLLFPGREALGEALALTDDLEVLVVGVCAPREQAGVDAFGYEEDHPLRWVVDKVLGYAGVFESTAIEALSRDDAALVPRTLFPDAAPDCLEIRADPPRILALRDRVRSVLAADGFEPVLYVNALLPILYGETLRMSLELARAVFLLSILVGTSVVSAVMVLSVVQRRHEIAIRRVEGARRAHIAVQFVVETGALCAAGGLLGVPVGLGLAAARCAGQPLASVTWTVPVLESAVMVGVVTLVGLFGGLVPAWSAVRVDPVVVLRNE